MAKIHPDKGYFEVASVEQQMAELHRRWTGGGKFQEYNANKGDECNVCHGRGYTRKTRTRVEVKKGKHVTTELGSGCVRCHGVGRV